MERMSAMESTSMVEICGTNRIKCGYCKPNTKTSVSYGLLAKRLTCADYQELIDRGWRRSGTFVYKPVMHETCCPQYTIRLDVTRFKPTKGQRHVLNRLRRYLDGDKDSGRSTTGSGQSDFSASSGPSSTGGKDGGSTGRIKKQDPKRTSANGDSRGEKSEMLGALTELVAAAAVGTVEGGIVPGLSLGPEWRSEVAGWSQVRPIRNKKKLATGRGFYTTVALNIASAARKRGWKGTGGAGGAIAIAEATAEMLRARGIGEGGGGQPSGVAVAANGFINFEADTCPPSNLASSTSAQPQPPPALLEARGCESPTPPETLPLPPAPGLALHGNSPVSGSAPGFGKDTATKKGAGRRESVPTSKAVEATAGSAKAAWSLSGEEAALPAEGAPMGKMGTVSGQGLNDSFTATAARLEWIERQGKRGGAMDMEVISTPPSGVRATGTQGPESRTGLAGLPPLDPSVSSHRMTVSTVPARVTEEVFRLYVKYQVSVHGDDPSEVTPGQFRRFLVDSPLIRETIGGTFLRPRKASSRRGPSRSAMMVDDEEVAQDEHSEMTEGQDSLSVPYGSYHQLYRIDGKLVAVGVVDILPKCLSSVYCFYDPAYRALALGKLTALKETQFVREAHAVRPALKDYYMGFYIHTCPKMSYKGSYTPSFLLCPERLTWVPLELCRPVLDAHKYARLSDLLESPQQRHAGGSQGAGGSPAQMSSHSGSCSPLSCLSPDRREVRQRSRKGEAGAVGSDGGGGGGSGGGGGGERAMEMVAAAARRAAAARAMQAAADEASGINDIPLKLGHPASPVNLTALTPESRTFVRDVLRAYVATIGPDLAKRIVLKLHD